MEPHDRPVEEILYDTLKDPAVVTKGPQSVDPLSRWYYAYITAHIEYLGIMLVILEQCQIPTACPHGLFLGWSQCQGY